MPKLSLRMAVALALLLPLGIFGLGSAGAQFRPPPQPAFPPPPRFPPAAPPAFKPPVVPANPQIPTAPVFVNVWRCRRCGWQVELPLSAPQPTCPNCSKNGGGVGSIFQPPAVPASNPSSTPGPTGSNAYLIGSIVGAAMGGVVLFVGLFFGVRAALASQKPKRRRRRRRLPDDDDDD
jgi:hypothetical protein